MRQVRLQRHHKARSYSSAGSVEIVREAKVAVVAARI